MIIKLILDVLYAVFSLLTAPINIPSLPDGVSEVISQYLEYLSAGFSILSCYVNMTYLLSLFGIVLLVDIGLFLYKFVMWILRKIPMLGIS